MRKLLFTIYVCSGLLLSSTSAGETLIFSCQSCHGDDFSGREALHAPALAGQLQGYLVKQLLNYRDGLRGTHEQDRYGAQMALIVANLTDEQIESLSAEISAMPGSDNPEPIKDPIYAPCIACHGAKGEGVEAVLGPAIYGLGNPYVAEQMRHFSNGVRGSHPEDHQGRVMAVSLPPDMDEAMIQRFADLLDGNKPQ